SLVFARFLVVGACAGRERETRIVDDRFTEGNVGAEETVHDRADLPARTDPVARREFDEETSRLHLHARVPKRTELVFPGCDVVLVTQTEIRDPLRPVLRPEDF